jgi:hypothetical protein
MPSRAPLLDPRSELQLAQRVRELLAGPGGYVPEWTETDPVTGDRTGGALISIFAHLAAIVVDRLNRAADKNFLAFLDLLGAAPLPPQPARVPLSFSLAAGSAVDAVVPVGTRVAAPPVEGEKEPVLFETERELVVTAAQLDSLFSRVPDDDRYADYSALVGTAVEGIASVFQGDRAVDHVLYLGDDALLGYPGLTRVDLSFTMGALPPLPDARQVQWEVWTAAGWVAITADTDSTAGLTKNGAVVFAHVAAFAPLPEHVIQQVTSRWLRCRLLTSVTLAAAHVTGKVRASQLPTITQVGLQVTVGRRVFPDAAFANAQAADLTKPFFPFGEKPKFGDTLYLAQHEAFADQRAAITLNVTLANPADALNPPPIDATRTDGNPQLTPGSSGTVKPGWLWAPGRLPAAPRRLSRTRPTRSPTPAV